MKKTNNILKVIGIAAVAGSITLFAACSNTQTTETPVNNAGVTQASNVSVTAQSVSLEDAIGIALAHAGIAREDARFTKTQFDNDDGVKKYEIDFIAGDKEYEYDVAESDGRILKSETEKEKNTAVNFSEGTTKASAAAPELTREVTQTSKTTKAQNAGYISVEDAKAAALKHASVAAENAKFEKAAFDVDDLIPHYDIEFYADGYEYDYEINAKTADVIEFGKEKERSNPAVTAASSFITAEEAKAAALKHAGVNAADARFEKTELDRDDAIPHYEIEFRAGRVEYEYEINAKTGSVIASEKDIDD